MISHSVNGSVRVEDGVGVISVVTDYPTPPEDLWTAITAPERLTRWFGQVQLRPDGAMAYDASLTTGWNGIIRVEECERPRIIRLAFLDESEPPTAVYAQLDAVDGGTRLTIEERGLPADDLATYVAGWHAQVEQLLSDLSGEAPVEWRPRWIQLRTDYRENLPT